MDLQSENYIQLLNYFANVSYMKKKNNNNQWIREWRIYIQVKVAMVLQKEMWPETLNQV